jgi:opacity protein-like surface antigen
MKKIILAILVSTTALSAVAYESKNNYSRYGKKQFYAQLNTGYAKGTKPGRSYDVDKLDDSFAVGMELGYNMSNHFRMSGSFDYFPGLSATNSDISGLLTTRSNYDGRAENFTFKGTTRIKAYALMLNAYIDITNGNLTPYITAGIGGSNNKASLTKSSYHSSNTIDGAKKLSFAYKVGAGLRYNYNRDLDIDLRYQYMSLGKFTTGGNANINTNNTNASGPVNPATGKIKMNVVMVGLAYKF